MIELSPGDILFDQPAADMEKEKDDEDRLRMWSSIELLRGGASADRNAKDARRERAQLLRGCRSGKSAEAGGLSREPYPCRRLHP